MANTGTTKLKKIVSRALEIREKAGFTTETISRKRYNMAYIPDAVKQAAKELKTGETKPAKRVKRYVKVQAFKSKLVRTKITEFPYQLGYNAYYWNSFSPEKRAKQTQIQYAKTLNDCAKEIEKHIKTKEQFQVAKTEFSRFKDGYTEKYKAWLSALGRTASSAVTGPAKFPVEKNRKAQNVEHNRSVELTDYTEKGIKSVIEKVRNSATPEMKEDEAWAEVKEKVTKSCIDITAIKKGKLPYNVQLFVTSLTGYLTRIKNNGRIEHYNRSLDLIEEYEKKTGVKIFAANNPIRTRAVEKVKTEADTETVEIYNKNGLRIENNKADERVRLFFDGKPSQAIINELKSHAWKWSPFNMAWQRKNTSDAFYFLRNFFIPQFIEK